MKDKAETLPGSSTLSIDIRISVLPLKELYLSFSHSSVSDWDLGRELIAVVFTITRLKTEYRILEFSAAANFAIGEPNLEFLTAVTKQLMKGRHHHIWQNHGVSIYGVKNEKCGINRVCPGQIKAVYRLYAGHHRVLPGNPGGVMVQRELPGTGCFQYVDNLFMTKLFCPKEG